MILKKKFKILAIIIAAILVITPVTLYILFNIFKISYNTTEKGEVESQISITRDSAGIPSIEVDSMNDFYFALGYLHAKDRINIIEYQRSIATSESERFALKDAALLNELCNTAGFTKSAEDITASLKEPEVSALKSYVKGINHVRTKSSVRNFLTREWTVEDVLAILMMKEWANSFLNNKELIFNLSDTKLPLAKNIFDDNRYLSFYNDDDTRHVYTLRRIKEIIEKYICSFSRGNSIYIPSEFSTNGKNSYTTLSFEDSTNIYPGWYPVTLVLKGKNIHAVTYNGLPFIMSFKSDSISLTQININADSQNFYLFETDTIDNTPRYKSGGTLKEYLSVRVPVFNGNEKASQIRWVTEKGPVFSDLISTAKKTDSKIIAIESIQTGTEYVNMMLRIPLENDIENINKILITNDSSLKCFIVSDNTNAFKIFSGMMNKPDNNNRIFIDGSNSSAISFAKSPITKISLIKKINGIDYVGSDLVTARDLPENYKNTVANDFKIERFNTLLVQKKIYDNDQIKNIITDTHSMTAEKFYPLFSSILGNNPLTSSKLSMIYFSDWDFTAKAGLQSPSIFYTVLNYYMTESYKDDFGKDSEFNLNSAYLLYSDFFKQCHKNVTTIFDKPETPGIETREMIFNTSFLAAMRFMNRKDGPYMENWRWGLITKSRYKIPDEKLNFLSRFFKIEDLPLSGGPDTIENIIQNSRFSTVSSTSFQSFMDNQSFLFKMNFAYSTSMLSDYYYGDFIIKDFEDMKISSVINKTIITN